MASMKISFLVIFALAAIALASAKPAEAEAEVAEAERSIWMGAWTCKTPYFSQDCKSACGVKKNGKVKNKKNTCVISKHGDSTKCSCKEVEW